MLYAHLKLICYMPITPFKKKCSLSKMIDTETNGTEEKVQK